MAEPTVTTAPKQIESKADKEQKRFYGHLLMHPSAHKCASRFAKKIVAGDADALAAVKDLASKASSDESAANTLRIVAVTLKYEHPSFKAETPLLAGGIPGLASAGKIIGLVLSPVSWALNTVGGLLHWGGGQVQHLGRIL